MTLNEYQAHALETAVYPEKYKVVYPALGLAGEAGETADKIKKVLRGDDGGVLTDEKRQAVAMEIGTFSGIAPLWPTTSAMTWTLSPR